MAVKRSKKDDTTPLWFLPVKRISAIIWPYFLIIGLVLMLVLLGLLFFKMISIPWLTTVSSIMSFCLIMAYIAGSCANWDLTTPGWAGLIFGAAAFNGAPYLILFISKINGFSDFIQKLKDTAVPSAVTNTPAAIAAAAVAKTALIVIKTFLVKFTSDLMNIGLTIAILAVMHLIFVFVIRIIRTKGQARKHATKYLDMTASDAVRRDYIPKCWQTSRCRPAVRKVCPNYLERTTCWKIRSGCFCQRDLANYLKEMVEDITEDTTTPSAQEMRDKKRNYEMIKQKLKSNTPKWKDQKERCFSCPIYSEHQEHKFRNLQWINFPITGLIVGVLFVPYEIAYKFAFTYLDNILLQVKIPYVTVSRFADSPFEWVLLGVLTIVILSYVMALTEQILLEWKW
ncbi:MAG: hypothetical protein WCO98_04695 [bacterium]